MVGEVEQGVGEGGSRLQRRSGGGRMKVEEAGLGRS